MVTTRYVNGKAALTMNNIDNHLSQLGLECNEDENINSQKICSKDRHFNNVSKVEC